MTGAGGRCPEQPQTRRRAEHRRRAGHPPDGGARPRRRERRLHDEAVEQVADAETRESQNEELDGAVAVPTTSPAERAAASRSACVARASQIVRSTPGLT